MFVAGRTLTAKSGRMADALSLTGAVMSMLNEKYGTNYSIRVDIGGNPNAIFLVTPFETLADYEQMRMSYMADQEINSMLVGSESIGDIVEDRLGEIIKPMGEFASFASVNTVRVETPKQMEATAFCLEVAELATSISGDEVGLVRPLTGDISELFFVSNFASMEDLNQSNVKLSENEDWLALYEKSIGLIVPGSLHYAIRQKVM